MKTHLHEIGTRQKGLNHVAGDDDDDDDDDNDDKQLFTHIRNQSEIKNEAVRSFSRLEIIQNKSIRERMQVSSINIMDTIEGRRLTWYGHLRRMPTGRWPLKIYNWIPPRRKKSGRPRLSWKDNVRQTMDDRHTTDEDWKDRERWKRGCGRRRMV
ncbi:hypothetical protein C0J52_25679 [Blattella germanica]|nr:hypothetical protein C0J52_25679 [Blattella germanica]